VSSPSAYELEVRANARREAAARAAATDRARAIEAALSALRAEALAISASDHAGETVDVPFVTPLDLDASRQVIEAWIVEGEEAAAALRSGIAAAKAQRADRKIVESLRKRVGGKAVSVDQVLRHLPTRPAPGAEDVAEFDWRVAAAEEAARLAGHLAASVFEDDREAIASQVAEVAASERAAQAAARVDRLRVAVQDALRTGADRPRHQAEGLELLGELRGLDHPDLRPVATALQCVVEGRRPLTDGMRAEARRVAAEAKAAADARYAVEVLAAAFAELNYDVQPGFTTELHAAGTIEFASGRSPGYGVRVHLDGRSRVRTHLVRYGEDETAEGGRRDRSAAQAFCDDLERVAEETAKHGVELDAKEQHPPGTMPLVVVKESDAGSRRRVAQPKQRERRA
jgi:hypothetical protein